MKIIECPRDAMQGIEEFIPTELKAKYINQLLKVGFDTIDFGSFVSPKAIPQMRDTSELLSLLHLEETNSKMLAIVANKRGAEDACKFDQIDFLGYPFSISETFQQKNTNTSIDGSLGRLEEIQALCSKHGKRLVVYLSMAFGNPYDELWHPDIAINWSDRLYNELEIDILALSDTIGVSNPENIDAIFSALIPALTEVEFGAHLHTTPEKWEEKIIAAHKAGCKRFDGAIKGYGGCPMAKDELTGNMPTEKMIHHFKQEGILELNWAEFEAAEKISLEVF